MIQKPQFQHSAVSLAKRDNVTGHTVRRKDRHLKNTGVESPCVESSKSRSSKTEHSEQFKER